MKRTKKPCVDCPFRRESPPGWIGAHENVREIINIVVFDGYFPCHREVNKLTEEQGWTFEHAVGEAPYCDGALKFMNNQFKRSTDDEILALQKESGKSEEIFQWPQQMEVHHDKKGGR